MSVIIVGGGDPISPHELDACSRLGFDDAYVIAADSGLDRAADAGLLVDVAIGDFDSVSAQALLRAEEDEIEIVRHPQVKNETDLELALVHAATLEPERILVMGIGGGRLDHFLAGLLLLGDDRFGDLEVDALVQDSHITVIGRTAIGRRRVITGSVGSIVTLLPIGGDAEGVSTNGLEYPLRNETLHAGSPRGLSNLFVAPLAVVEVKAGALFTVQELS